MIRYPYEKALYRALQRDKPEGYTVSIVRHGKRLVITIRCDDPSYFAPWAVNRIASDFGYRA